MLYFLGNSGKQYLRLIFGLLLWVASTSCTNSGTVHDDQTIKDIIGKLPLKVTKHALCRMSCRHIDEQEIAAVLRSGTINYQKSDTRDTKPCRKKYAVEGITQDGQRVRIIVAPCSNQVTIITVIDLGVEWKCNCR